MENREITAKDICQCDFCRKFDFSEASAVIEYGKYAHIHLAMSSYRFPVYEQFNYCPWCGRPNPNKLRGG